jgi:hypothetical protein
LIQFSAKHFDAVSPMHAKLQATLMAIEFLKDSGMEQGIIVMDRKQLTDVFLSKSPPVHLDWRLYSQVSQAWLFFKDNYGISVYLCVESTFKRPLTLLTGLIFVRKIFTVLYTLWPLLCM